jgi:hypothetical protein
MKKLLSTTLIFVIFTALITIANAAPLPTIVIESEEELSEMREMLNTSDEELAEFLSRTGHIWNGMSRREHIVMFLEYIDSLPLAYIAGTQFEQIVYMVRSSSTYIVFSTEIDETYTLRYNFVDKNLIANREPVFKHYINQEKYINVYTYPNSHNSKLNEHGAISFIMEIDGILIRTGYNRGRGNEHITTFNPQEAYSDMIITSFAEAPWSTISPAVVEELIVEEPLTTADAMTVLRAVAGLVAMTEEEAARFEISGAPSTGDAMRILRVVAGL